MLRWQKEDWREAMTIKDFKQGQAVYSLEKNHNTKSKYRIDEYVVISVGRKYVKAAPKNSQNYPKEFYLNNITDEYLYENRDWGYREMLFLTKEAAGGYIEKEALLFWLRNLTYYLRDDKYSLEQLREVKKILGEE